MDLKVPLLAHFNRHSSGRPRGEKNTLFQGSHGPERAIFGPLSFWDIALRMDVLFFWLRFFSCPSPRRGGLKAGDAAVETRGEGERGRLDLLGRAGTRGDHRGRKGARVHGREGARAQGCTDARVHGRKGGGGAGA